MKAKKPSTILETAEQFTEEENRLFREKNARNWIENIFPEMLDSLILYDGLQKRACEILIEKFGKRSDLGPWLNKQISEAREGMPTGNKAHSGHKLAQILIQYDLLRNHESLSSKVALYEMANIHKRSTGTIKNMLGSARKDLARAHFEPFFQDPEKLAAFLKRNKVNLKST
mgnify:CR=1 FL=1